MVAQPARVCEGEEGDGMSEPMEHLTERWVVDAGEEEGPVIVTEPNRWNVVVSVGCLPGDDSGVATLGHICRLHNASLKTEKGG